MLTACSSSRTTLRMLFSSLFVCSAVKDALYQKLFAFGWRHLLQQRPRAAVLRFIEVRAENILRSFHTSVLYQQTAIKELASLF